MSKEQLVSDDQLMKHMDDHVHWRLVAGDASKQAMYHSLRQALDFAVERLKADQPVGSLESDDGTVISQEQIMKLLHQLGHGQPMAEKA